MVSRHEGHIGVDTVTGLAHSVAVTLGKVVVVTMLGHLVREGDKRVCEDAGYTGMGNMDEEKNAKDSRFCIAAKRGTALLD